MKMSRKWCKIFFTRFLRVPIKRVFTSCQNDGDDVVVVLVSCPWIRSDRSVHNDPNTGQLRCLVRMDVLFWIDILTGILTPPLRGGREKQHK
ncbi:hypothetical protein LAZ67_22000577 [Cordylochernes scorpioides]|uniref:Secreted protein n=1 Tax=Cordylochernes scorpioides TaxID=51811 RepID=A0ABY6LT59_9ARAC|nr:hypothetical protein LAZ67_22000577 [Cordylochernes scorpioides]